MMLLNKIYGDTIFKINLINLQQAAQDSPETVTYTVLSLLKKYNNENHRNKIFDTCLKILHNLKSIEPQSAIELSTILMEEFPEDERSLDDHLATLVSVATQGRKNIVYLRNKFADLGKNNNQTNHHTKILDAAMEVFYLSEQFDLNHELELVRELIQSFPPEHRLLSLALDTLAKTSKENAHASFSFFDSLTSRYNEPLYQEKIVKTCLTNLWTIEGIDSHSHYIAKTAFNLAKELSDQQKQRIHTPQGNFVGYIVRPDSRLAKKAFAVSAAEPRGFKEHTLIVNCEYGPKPMTEQNAIENAQLLLERSDLSNENTAHYAAIKTALMPALFDHHRL